MKKTIIALLACVALLPAMPVAAKSKSADIVTEAQLRAHIAVLASDEFEGRDPGTPGEVKTTDYIIRQWEDAGLKPAYKIDTDAPSWLQPVELTSFRPQSAKMTLRGKGKALTIDPANIVLRSPSNTATIRGAAALFVNYGIDANGNVPADISGKILFVLFADPPEAKMIQKGGTGFRARREKLLNAGAAAVIGLIGYDVPWDQIKASMQNAQMSLTAPGAPSTAGQRINGLMNLDEGNKLFAASGLNLPEIMKLPDGLSAKPVAMPVTIDLDVQTENRQFTSYNVLGYLPAAKPTTETILIMGHWDHLGLCRPEGAEDRICNGAVDNASGIAVMIEVAKRLGKDKAMDRNILFFATTAEERGLLGAFSFAGNPPAGFPLNGIVAALNIDTIAIADRGAPVAIIGRGTTNLDQAIDKVAKKLGRKIDSDLEANAFIQRQDGWALASKKVPTAMIGGSFSDLNKLEAFLGTTYHGPEDELVDNIPLGGAAEDADLHVALVRYLANRKTWKKTVLTPSPDK
jgi:Peptidase family M28